VATYDLLRAYKEKERERERRSYLIINYITKYNKIGLILTSKR